MRGFFRNILNQKVAAPTFVSIVEDLWTQVQKYSSSNKYKNEIR